MATYIGKWDCPACGTKRIPGWKDGRTVERCPSCNSPSTKKWYLDNREMVISNPEEVAKAKTKRAWTCGHCGAVHDNDDTSCDACGNPRDTTSDDKTTQSRTYAPGTEPKSGEAVPGVKETELGGEHDRPALPGEDDHTWHCPRCGIHNQPYHNKCKGCDLAKDLHKSWKPGDKSPSFLGRLSTGKKVVLIVIGFFLLVFSGFIPKTVEVVVTDFAWERSVSIQDYAERSRSDWYSAPPGAYNITSQREVHHYDQVFSHTDCQTETYTCGTTDNGNGTFSDQYCTRESCTDVYDDVPVYETKYYYNIMDWEHHHYENSAAEDKKPFWPKDSRTKSNPSAWREGGRTGTYYVYAAEPDGTVMKREMEESRWNSTKTGDQETGKKAWLYGTWYGFD